MKLLEMSPKDTPHGGGFVHENYKKKANQRLRLGRVDDSHSKLQHEVIQISSVGGKPILYGMDERACEYT
jgi:hypothetical protein